MRGVYTILAILLLIILDSCSEECRDSVGLPSGVRELTVNRIEIPLFSAKSPGETLVVLRANPSFAQFFLNADQYPHDSILAKRIFKLTSDPSIDTLYEETLAAFPDLDWLAADLGEAMVKLQFIFPEMKTPRIETGITGLFTDLYISDSVVIIGLDYFIGPTATYKPLDIPGYILTRYTRHHLTSTITKFLIGASIESSRSETMLSEMIDFGKTFYIQSRVLPCTPDSILMGYSSREMQLVKENEAIIWANFVENQLLYETNHFMKRKFLAERPNVHEISAECPGRIGTWVGWQIVEGYMKNNTVSFQELFEERDYEKIFRLSGYKPKP